MKVFRKTDQPTGRPSSSFVRTLCLLLEMAGLLTVWMAAALVLPGRVCQAQNHKSTVIVLTIRSLDGNDRLAHNLSEAMRKGARVVPDWDVSDHEVSLAQMSLAHGCHEPNARCMADIAGTLKVDRLIYGTSEQAGSGVRVSLHNFDAVTGHLEGSYEGVIAATELKSPQLERLASRLAQHLSGNPASGSLQVQGDVPGARVHVDGQDMGELDAHGTLRVEGVAAGDREVTVEADGARVAHRVKVREGRSAMVRVELSAPNDPSKGEDGQSEVDSDRNSTWRRRAGWASIGLAGGMLLGTAVIWSKIENINSHAALKEYRSMFPPASMGGTSDVCIEAALRDPGDGSSPGIAARVDKLCDDGRRLEALQWVFLAGTVTATATGTLLLLRNREKNSERQLSLSPIISLRRAGARVSLKF